MRQSLITYFFFFNDTATTEIYTLSLHDALPIFCHARPGRGGRPHEAGDRTGPDDAAGSQAGDLRRAWRRSRVHCLLLYRSEEHTSELQSLAYLVCRLLLEKKKRLARCIMQRIER